MPNIPRSNDHMILSMPITQENSTFFGSAANVKNWFTDSGIKIIRRIYGDLYKEGERIHELFFILDGKISLYKKDEYGTKVKLFSVKRGGVLGFQSLQCLGIASHTAKVKGITRLLVIPREKIPGFLSRSPKLREHLISEIIQQIDLLRHQGEV